MITNYKIRKTTNIRGNDNGVLYFDYIKKLSQDYSAISLEGLSTDREQGYFDILSILIDVADLNQEQNALGYYSELEPLQDNNRILKYKGYWWVKSSLNKKYANSIWKRYPFLVNKKEFRIPVGNRFRIGGVAYLDLKKIDEIDDLIKSVSYKIDRGFFFLLDKNELDRFDIAINQANYSKTLDFVLSQRGIVFILLGDEDFKTPEIVAISNGDTIKKMIHNLECNDKIILTNVP